MTNQILKNNIDQSNAHRFSRDENAFFILNNIGLFPDFMEIVFDVND